MIRRPSTPLAVAALGLVSACGGGGPESPPDILLISLDTLRADRVSAYGSRQETTPNLDRIAASGVLFSEACSPASQTAPSHVSIFSGLDPLAHGVRNTSRYDESSTRLADNAPMLSELVQAAGWYTGVIGDTGNVHPDMGFDRGFDFQVFGMQQLPAKLPQVNDFCDEVPDGQPAFLFVHTYQIHSPYVPPARYFGKFADQEYQGVFRQRYDRLVGKPMSAVFGEAAEFLTEFEGMGPDDVAWLSDLYDDNVRWTDFGIGKLLEIWRERRGEDSIVIVLSDHGEQFGEQGNLGHRTGLTRVLTHVPLIVAGPGVGRGVVDRPVSLTGIPATLCDLLGLEMPAAFQVGSFADALRDPATFAPGGPAFEQLLIGRKAGFFEGVTDDRWHLVRASVDGDVTESLFDLDSDPSGLLDVRDQHEEVVGSLLSELSDRRRQNVDLQTRFATLRGPRLSVQRQQELEALGYTDR
ncbi:sulfatase [Engelhardtia mirabilis]|uniref:Choline-sulfatase n=1 Tax=Engelhardtia mirabilis TaxID=2528011 RepID=A0A518BIB4_9BACT|nr:Choline-sulfatase [Planctomycetes bacterium Pla133]QDV01043.1 Choline-sulfatase [Planctomycetes bacterium Pla86]